MKKFRIAVIPGDEIGKEVISEGVKVLKKISELDGSFAFDFVEFPWGCEYYLKTGKMVDVASMNFVLHPEKSFLF